MFPEPTELLLIGCLIESIWTPRSKSNTLTPKNQLADILTKGNFTRDEWNHLLCLFNISHFSSTNCLEVMSKRTQEDAGEERFTAKSKPMMNLVSRCSVRDRNVLASTASESPGKTQSESQKPVSSWNEQQPRTGRPVVALAHQTTQNGIYWRKVVFSRVDIWWNVGSKNGETRKWTISRFVHTAHGQIYCWWRWYGL